MFVRYEIKDAVACITFTRPESFNAMNTDMRAQVLAALQNAASDKTVRAVYITGEGKAFCAGQDLVEVLDPNGPDLDKIISTGYNPIVSAIRNMEKPIVCAVNGVAAGAGANIAVACDITVASESASFTQAFSKIGLVPDSGGTWTLPRLVGMQRATALMFLSDKISAKEAEAMGMIWKVFPNDEFAESSFKIAQQLAQMPTKAFAYTKQLLNASFSNTFQEQIDLEGELQTMAGRTHDYTEGVTAFVEKRRPEYKGK